MGGQLDQSKRQEPETGGGSEPAQADPDTVRGSAPSPDVSQQPGFKVVTDEPSRGGTKLVWAALAVAILIIGAYAAGLIR